MTSNCHLPGVSVSAFCAGALLDVFFPQCVIVSIIFCIVCGVTVDIQ